MTASTELIEPSITFLNMSGDVTLTWNKDSEDAILALVQAKMSEGYSFFILKPRKLGFLPLPAKKVLVTDIEQARKAGTVSMTESDVRQALNVRVDDPEVAKVLNSGAARLARVPKSNSHDTVARASSAAEVVGQQTVAIRPIAGG